MTVLQVRDLHLSFGTRVLFNDVTFSVSLGDHIAIVGRNGAGKSTMMKAIAKQVPLDSGVVTLGRGATLGYLAQDLIAAPVGTLLESVLSTVPARDALRARYAEAELSLASATDEADQLELAARLVELGEAVNEFDQRFGEHRAARLLTGLGFKQTDFSRPLREFSGGWRMRAALSGLLLSDPDVLMLDEPTNHLDVPTLAWFDQFLKRSRRALLLISHDRTFLNRHAKRVLHVNRGKVDDYTGNLDRFEEQRQQRRELLQAQATAIDLKRESLQTFVDRFGAKASKASQAQSKAKQLEKLERIEVETDERSLGFRFPEVQASGKEVIRVQGLKKSFSEAPLFTDVTQVVQRGERIGIVGPNGAGKTTLLRLIAKELDADQGTVELGHNVVMSYFAQHHADKLGLDRTIYQELDALVPDASPAKLRQVAGAFLFSGDDIDKRISVLSGGERARVALAKLLLIPSNLLLLDEPTNHLDLDSSEALIQALKSYPGTVLFVSHNESFVQQLATKLWEVGDGHAHSFPGTFTDYVARLVAAMDPDPERSSEGGGGPVGDKESAKERRQREARERDARRAMFGPIEKEIKRLELQITALETEQVELEAKLADVSLYDKPDDARKVTQRFDVVRKQLEKAMNDWTLEQEKLAALGTAPSA